MDSSGLLMKYFVLSPNKKGPYGDASRRAIQAYARAIRTTNPFLYKDLIDWTGRIERNLRAEEINNAHKD